jgi:hypothetical protein
VHGFCPGSLDKTSYNEGLVIGLTGWSGGVVEEGGLYAII